MTLSTFEPLKGSTFRVPISGGDVSLVLVSAEAIPLSKVDPRARGIVDGVRSDPFTLLFEGPSNVPFPQGTYRVIDPRGVEIMLFLVPVGPSKVGLLYEALFN